MTEVEKQAIDKVSKRAVELMKDWGDSRKHQYRFVLAYVGYGFTNKKQSAIDAGICPSRAAGHSTEYLNRPQYKHVQEVIEELRLEFMNLQAGSEVASCLEVQKFFTQVMRAELDDCVLANRKGGNQEPIMIKASLKDRLKAAENLARIQGQYIEKVESKTTNEVVVIQDDI